MKRLFLILLLLSFNIKFALADDVNEKVNPNPFIIKDKPVVPNYSSLEQGIKAIKVDLIKNGEPVANWTIDRTNWVVLLKKLSIAETSPQKIKKAQPKPVDSTYEGLKVTLQMLDNDQKDVIFKIFNGKIKEGKNNFYDYDRNTEYWIFGSVKSFGEQLYALNVLPIISYDQCVTLNNKIVGTSPRQCILQNNTIFIEGAADATPDSLNVKTFDECLLKGLAIIGTFPRRCFASGGRVYTEPARLRDDVYIPLIAMPISPLKVKGQDLNTSGTIKGSQIKK